MVASDTGNNRVLGVARSIKSASLVILARLVSTLLYLTMMDVFLEFGHMLAETRQAANVQKIFLIFHAP